MMRVGYAQTIQEATEKGGFAAAVVIGNYDYFIVNYVHSLPQSSRNTLGI